MYDYFLFYWITWMVYIIVYFFTSISFKRYALLTWILLIISTVDIFVDIGIVRFSVGFLIVLLGAIIYFIKDFVNTRKLFYAFIMMIGYVGLLIWHQLAPIWFFLPAYLMLPISIVICMFLLQRDIEKALPILLLSMSLGQCMYQAILMTYYLTDKIGSLHLLIQISVVVILLTWIHALQLVIRYISLIVHRKLI